MVWVLAGGEVAVGELGRKEVWGGFGGEWRTSGKRIGYGACEKVWFFGEVA